MSSDTSAARFVARLGWAGAGAGAGAGVRLPATGVTALLAAGVVAVAVLAGGAVVTTGGTVLTGVVVTVGITGVVAAVAEGAVAVGVAVDTAAAGAVAPPFCSASISAWRKLLRSPFSISPLAAGSAGALGAVVVVLAGSAVVAVVAWVAVAGVFAPVSGDTFRPSPCSTARTEEAKSPPPKCMSLAETR